MPRVPVPAAVEANLRTAARLRVPRPEPGLIGIRAMHHASHPAPGVSASQQARLTPTRQQPVPVRNLVSPVPARQPRQPYATTTNASSPSQLPPAPDGPEPIIHPVFETQTSTYQYLVADPATKTAVIIDPVLDYDPTKRQVSTQAADELLSLAREKGYTISHILETHAHADHLTASFYLQRKLEERQGTKPPVGIGRRIGQVQTMFGKRYGIDSEEYDGVFDILWEDDAEFKVGELRGRVLHLPGHTPDHVGYWIGDNVFCGDSLFHPSIGTARCDFPGGSAYAMYSSARKLLSMPDHVKIWVGHDYPDESRAGPEPMATVGEHRARNKHVREGVSEEEFVAMRRERDSSLSAPRLVHESLQVNIRAGHLPKANGEGMRLFHLPVKIPEGL